MAKTKLTKVLIVIGVIIATIAILLISVAITNSLHKSEMEKYIDTYTMVEYDDQLHPSVDELGNYYFITDGDFKVMQLTDIHLGGGFLFADGDKRAIHAVASMVSKEKPDLVIVTGDISFAVPWSGTLNNSIAHGYFKRLMENLGVYWTVTFGNHDSEKYNYYDRAAVAQMYSDESLNYCLFSSGPDDVFGECNHIITVRNSQGLTTSSYVMIDSNAYTDKDVFGLGWDYDNVHDDQVEWYRGTIEYYTQKNLEVYNALEEDQRPASFNPEAITSYMYMHIPPEEMLKAYNAIPESDLTNRDLYGIIGEGGQVVYSSEYPDNLFETVKNLGSTKAIFFGHDHLNSLHILYDGVLMAYGYSIDYSAYAGATGYQRGCTILTVSRDGVFDLEYSNYYSGEYDNLDDNVDMQLPDIYN